MPRNRSEKHPPELIECAKLYLRWADEQNANGRSDKEYDLYMAYAQHQLKMPRDAQSIWRKMIREGKHNATIASIKDNAK